MKKLTLFLCLFSLLTALAYGDGGSDYQIIREENAELKARLLQLEQKVKTCQPCDPAKTGQAENCEMIDRLNSLERQVKGLPAAPDNSGIKAENRALKSEVMQMKEEMRALSDVTAKLADDQKKMSRQQLPTINDLFQTKRGYDVDLYGYIKFDAIWNDSQIAGIDGVSFWAQPETDRNNNDDEFSMTARQSRIGIDISGPKDDDIVKTAKVEMDFYGAQTQSSREDRAALRLRHAYFNLDFRNGWQLLAGQTWDVISPLSPHTLDFGVHSFGGNLGYRSPQLRLTRTFKLSEEAKLVAQMALSTPKDVSDRYNVFKSATSMGHAQDSGKPVLQARVAYSPCKNHTVGFSGHIGQDEYDISSTVDDSHETVDTWSLNMDGSFKLTDSLTLMGECHYGQNLNSMYGGICEGVVIDTMSMGSKALKVYGVQSKGGWVQLLYKINDKWSTSLGYGMEKNNTKDMDKDLTSNFRIRNRVIFGNVMYQVCKDVSCGVELSHYQTEYYRTDDGDALRGMFSMMYHF